MKANTCPRGKEQWSVYYSSVLKKELVEYDYRTENGVLFSCVATCITIARMRRDKWLRDIAITKEKGN